MKRPSPWPWALGPLLGVVWSSLGRVLIDGRPFFHESASTTVLLYGSALLLGLCGWLGNMWWINRRSGQDPTRAGRRPASTGRAHGSDREG